MRKIIDLFNKVFIQNVLGVFLIYAMLLFFYISINKYLGLICLWLLWGILLLPDKSLPKRYHKIGWLICYPFLIPLIEVRAIKLLGDKNV